MSEAETDGQAPVIPGGGRRTGRVTMTMVARKAGVSIATVSYILAGKRAGRTGPVALPETINKVTQAAAELGYQPNQAARAMRTGKTRTIMLSMTTLQDPWALEVVEALSEGARTHELTPLILADDDWNLALHRTETDAIFIDNVTENQRPFLTELAGAGKRLVVFDPVVQPDGFDVVRSFDLSACRLLVDGLLDEWSDVALLGVTAPGTRSAREQVYVDAHEERGLSINPEWDTSGARTPERAYAAAFRLLQSPQRPKAIYAPSDYLAISAVHAAQSLGLEVGVDVAIAGVGNTRAGQILDPPLTSVGPTGLLEGLAALVMELALDKRQPGQIFEYPWHVHTRTSTGSPLPETTL